MPGKGEGYELYVTHANARHASFHHLVQGICQTLHNKRPTTRACKFWVLSLRGFSTAIIIFRMVSIRFAFKESLAFPILSCWYL